MTREKQQPVHGGQSDAVVEVGGIVDETRLTLGLYGQDLDPDDISTTLRCSPTSSHRRGDPRRVGRPPWPQGAWLLRLEGNAPVGPNELVQQLLDRLPVAAEVWEGLRAKYTVQLTVGIFLGSWNRGFELSCVSLSRIGELGVSLGFDLYADTLLDDQEEPEEPAT
jgi:hypothetical protein